MGERLGWGSLLFDGLSGFFPGADSAREVVEFLEVEFGHFFAGAGGASAAGAVNQVGLKGGGPMVFKSCLFCRRRFETAQFWEMTKREGFANQKREYVNGKLKDGNGSYGSMKAGENELGTGSVAHVAERSKSEKPWDRPLYVVTSMLLQGYNLDWEGEAFWDRNFRDTLEPYLLAKWNKLVFMLDPGEALFINRLGLSHLKRAGTEFEPGRWLFSGQTLGGRDRECLLHFMEHEGPGVLWIGFPDEEGVAELKELYRCSPARANPHSQVAAELLLRTGSVCVWLFCVVLLVRALLAWDGNLVVRLLLGTLGAWVCGIVLSVVGEHLLRWLSRGNRR